ncbi:MAG: hypothetical protein HYU69_15070 [Bacteroidetes bacterium]|nr:hypothetical protein [Bacteroidota bacterium]
MNSTKLRIIAIKAWRLFYLRFTAIFDFIFYRLRIPAVNISGIHLKDKKLVVFVGEFLAPRIPRMAKWLKRADSSFVALLLCHRSGYVEKFSNDSFDQTILFRNEWHLRRIIRQLPSIYIIHGFAPKSFFPDIARKMAKCPYVHDMQDVYSIYYGLNPTLNWLKKELPHEKECLEKADGIVAHSLEPNAAYGLFKTKQKPKTLFFPLYCDDDVFQQNNKILDPDNMHLVYAGGVAGSHRNPKQYGNIQFHNLIKTLSEQKIHFHIYPSPSNIKADYEEYEKIAKGNSYFHFHNPLGQEVLAKELSKYHFGILPFFKELSEQSLDKLKYATTLKLFNYIEAGIPLIVSGDLDYQSWLVNRYQIGCIIQKDALPDLKNILRKTSYNKLVINLNYAKTRLSIKKNVTRIISFYQSFY